jgi:hypothetical protein
MSQLQRATLLFDSKFETVCSAAVIVVEPVPCLCVTHACRSAGVLAVLLECCCKVFTCQHVWARQHMYTAAAVCGRTLGVPGELERAPPGQALH